MSNENETRLKKAAQALRDAFRKMGDGFEASNKMEWSRKSTWPSEKPKSNTSKRM